MFLNHTSIFKSLYYINDPTLRSDESESFCVVFPELQFLLCYDSEFAEVEYTPLALDSVDSSFPEYLKEQIFFESAQAPNFLRRLIQTFQKPDK